MIRVYRASTEGDNVPRRRWRLQPRREELPEAWRCFFSTGNKYGAPEENRGPVLCWAQYEPMWRRHGETFTAAWIAEHAGSRPWGWWRYTGLSARKVIRGGELVDTRAPFDWWWRQHA